MVSDELLADRWNEFASAITRLAVRVGDPNDFPVRAGSSLSGDDQASHPFEVSQAIRHLINATVDQLHGVKVAVCDAQHQHLAVSATLARTALENAASALWILGPRLRNARLERVLRWHARNYHDLDTYLAARGHEASDIRARNTAAIDDVRNVANRRGIDPAIAAAGFGITTPIKGAAEFTALPVFTDWQIASGFAHARPWAHQGFLRREQIGASEGGHTIFRMTAREEMTAYLPVQALHLLAEVIRLRDRRAGLKMAPLPDGSPDSEPPAR